MPRHLTAPIPTRSDPHPAPYAAPHTFQPERIWIIDNYRVRTWYYRDAPTAGDRVHYMDGSFTRIRRVTSTQIYLDSSNDAMRRPYLTSRLIAWVQPRLRHGLTPERRQKATRYVPNGATLYV